MATPEDVERASEFAFKIFQIPAAMWYGTKTAFSQTMPLTTQTFSNVYVFTQLYVVVALIVFALLIVDAGAKLLKMYRLMLLGRLRPWRCVRRFMGFTEVSQDTDSEHDDVLSINVPLTGYILQIITMFSFDVLVSFPISLFWITWLPILLIMTFIACRQPKHYYTHLQSIRGHYTGIPRRTNQSSNIISPSIQISENPFDEDDEEYEIMDCKQKKKNGHPTSSYIEESTTEGIKLESDGESDQFSFQKKNEEGCEGYQAMPRLVVDPASRSTVFVLPHENQDEATPSSECNKESDREEN